MNKAIKTEYLSLVEGVISWRLVVYATKEQMVIGQRVYVN